MKYSTKITTEPEPGIPTPCNMAADRKPGLVDTHLQQLGREVDTVINRFEVLEGKLNPVLSPSLATPAPVPPTTPSSSVPLADCLANLAFRPKA